MGESSGNGRCGCTDRDVNTALLGLITRLKIICNFDALANVSAKFDALKTISESAGESARILVFSQFVETLQWISDRFELPHDLLTGSMSLAERQNSIDRFKAELTPDVSRIPSGRRGRLNLGEATHSFFSTDGGTGGRVSGDISGPQI